MDMDFLSDPIFDLDRSDFIGGIDNEALDFEHLEQFMHVGSNIGDIDETNNGNINNGNSNSNSNSTNHNSTNHNNNNSINSVESGVVCVSKVDPSCSTSAPHSNVSAASVTIATVSARVSLTTTPIATPLPPTAVVGHAGTPHMPESPPDSGSEPPYSPLQDVQGLTLTSRDAYNNGLPGMHQSAANAGHSSLHELHMQSQFTPPHQHSQLQFSHNLQHHLNANQSPHASHAPEESTNEIRIKHEAGLLMNPSSLVPHLQGNNLLSAHHHVNGSDAHIDIPGHQLMYPNLNVNGGVNNFLPYDGLGAGMYTNVSYQNVIAVGNGETVHETSYVLAGSMADVPRVQVIGTSQASQTQVNRPSLPSTPVHLSSSRKRKLSTQIDCPDYTTIKPDPGLSMSPLGSSSLSGPLANGPQNMGPTSPVSISLPVHNNNSDITSTPAHSSASLSPALSTVNSHHDTNMDGSLSNNPASNASGNAENGDGVLTPCIRFSPFQPQNWHKLCDHSLQDIAVVYYRVDADKGFNFSVSDDAFVCQKKNHFQITCHARLQGEAEFVKTPAGLEKIKSFHLHFYGVKLEAPNQTIRVEQSQSDRSKKPFYPVPIDLQSRIVSKVTVGRLHFSETTNNNMRKKGRPNPEQRYFQLVVGLHVHTISGDFPIISQGSERIIVRASNPGQFESDVDLCWQRGLTQDSIFHAGRVGINTDRPDESLVVHGNLKVSGHIVQPSDSRAKQEIGELDTSVQLRNLQKIRIVRYRYEPEFAIHSGLKRASGSDSEEIVDTGVIAQEVREVIPDAVQEAGSIVLPNGNVIENFLLVNKDRILMENIGAVKELCKVTGSLETRIEDLERSHRIVRAREFEQRAIQYRPGKFGVLRGGYEMCSNKSLQIVIFLLVIVMAACLAAVSTLYFMEHNKQHHNYMQLDRLQLLGNSHIFSHEPVSMNQNEGYLVQLHDILRKNKTFLYSSTSRPPNRSNHRSNRPEITYNESDEIYTTHGRNDELAAVMEKPLVSLQPLQSHREAYKVTTTSPLLRNNKTISNKNKKRPQQQQQQQIEQTKVPTSPQLLRIAAGPLEGGLPSYNVAPSIGTVQEPKVVQFANASEPAAEKASDSIPLPHDFENNSIDIDAQHVTKKPSAANSQPSGSHGVVESSNEASSLSLLERTDTDVAPKLSERIADTIRSTSSSNNLAHVPDTTASAHIHGLNNVYKTVSPPSANLALTTNKVTIENAPSNHSLEAPPVSNKSHGILDGAADNADASDLQNLSNTNESADNPITALFGFEFGGTRESSLERRSTSQRSIETVTRKIVQIEAFGAPHECLTANVRTAHDEPSICQSFCSEESNQLQLSILTDASQHGKLDDHHHQQISEIGDIAESEGRSAIVVEPKVEVPVNLVNSSKITPGKISHSSRIVNKAASIEQLSEDTDTLDTNLEHSLSEEEPFDILEPKIVVDKNVSPLQKPSLEVHQLTPSDCWRISSLLWSDNLNETFGNEEFCPNIGKSLNLTYIIPLSQYFKDSTIEIRLSSSLPLSWTICNNLEHTKHDGKHLLNSPTHHHQYNANIQRHHNTTKLVFNIPNRGYFVRDLALRATNDFTKQNICQEKAHEANTLLQYNFRIVRDCD